MRKETYVLTNGIKYIKLNQNDSPQETTDYHLAHEFKSIAEANAYLGSKHMKNIKSRGGRRYNVVSMDEIDEMNLQRKIALETNQYDTKTREIIDSLYNSYDKNCHSYKGLTEFEKMEIPLESLIKECITLFSQLDNYIQNMEYQMRECEIKREEIYHFLRELKNKKPNACGGAKLTYLSQQLEQTRWECKKNAIIAKTFRDDINRIKDKNYIDIVDKISNTPYRYTRYNIDDLKKLAGVK